MSRCAIVIYLTIDNYIFVLFFSPRTEMTAENLRWLENVFRRTVGENGEIRLQDFKNIVHSKNVSLLIDQIYLM